MRAWFSIPALCLAGTLASASPWEDFVQRRSGADPRQAKWVLCVRNGEFSNAAAYADPLFQKMLTSGDFSLEVLNSAVAQDLWARRGWGAEPHWLLLSPAGEEAAAGPGQPRSEALRDAVHAAGRLLRFEARAEFLREHPDQGEALLEEANHVFQVLRVRVMYLDRAGKVRVPAWHPEPGARPPAFGLRISLGPGDQGEAMADELYADAADVLEKLMALPGWQREAVGFASHLAHWDAGQSTRMRRLCLQVARALEQRLKEDPDDADLANFWVEALDAAGQVPEDLGGLCVPVPGEPWPEAGMVGRLLEPFYRRKDWNGALKALGDLMPQVPPDPMTAHGWEAYRRLQGAVLAHRGLCLAALGSMDLAAGALASARRVGGGEVVRETLLSRGALFSGPGGDANTWRQLLSQTLAKDSEPPPMPPVDPPLRLVVAGMPKWFLPWTALRTAPDLAPWSPSELHWEVADPGTFQRLRARHGWGPEPRWALYRGEDLRATGTSCPNAQALAGILGGEGLTQLQRLQQVVEAQPDHIAARRERFELALGRMPDPRLEATMAEDAAQALVALEFDPKAAWKPDPEVWGAAAMQALPNLEPLVRAWPNRTYLWRAWLSWARFHPARPSVLALAQSVPFWSWSPQGDRNAWRAWLPYEVQRAIAEEMRRTGNFTAMRDWFQGVWEALDHRPLSQVYRGERTWVLERRREEETSVYLPLREALTALQCTEELAELDRVFGEMMGRPVNRRR